jgi:hypothetical protein
MLIPPRLRVAPNATEGKARIAQAVGFGNAPRRLARRLKYGGGGLVDVAMATKVPAFVAAALGVNAPNALVVSQAALSVAPAVPMISLAAVTRRRDIMGNFGQTPTDRRARHRWDRDHPHAQRFAAAADIRRRDSVPRTSVSDETAKATHTRSLPFQNAVGPGAFKRRGALFRVAKRFGVLPILQRPDMRLAFAPPATQFVSF